jgi:titin
MHRTPWHSWLTRQGTRHGGRGRANGRRPYRPRLEALEERRVPTTFLVINSNDSGEGSLRQAILDANNNPGPDTINFAIGPGVQVITTLSPLPAITDAVDLDATTMQGQQIQLDSRGLPMSGTGLIVLASDCMILGLSVTDFVTGGIQVGNGSNVFQGDTIDHCLVGTDFAGDPNLGNGFGVELTDVTDTAVSNCTIVSSISGPGVLVRDSSGVNANLFLVAIHHNFIGCLSSGASDGNTGGGVYVDGVIGSGLGNSVIYNNVISGNNQFGVEITDFSQGVFLQSNLIGLDPTGSSAVPNTGDGIDLNQGASGNQIGYSLGYGFGYGNVISGNTGDGVNIDGRGTTGNLVLLNDIGTDGTGANAVPNQRYGVVIENGASGNTIGGTNFGANLISGDGLDGVLISGTGTTGTGTTGNVVLSNKIGTAATGTKALPNQGNGVVIDNGAFGNTIGGAGAGNLISGNQANGVLVSDSLTENNTIQDNQIGTNAAGGVGTAGGAAIPNLGDGVAIENGASGNTVGGASSASCPAAGNLISGNGLDGVLVSGSSNNTIQANQIGTDALGHIGIHNGQDGVGLLANAIGNFVGGTAPGAGNLISGNSGNGVFLSDGSALNSVQGNKIGTDTAGQTAIGNTFDGVLLASSATANTIGGTTAGAGNLISGNGEFGVAISPTSNFNLLQGNKIGTDGSGTIADSNGLSGIEVDAYGNTVGGTATGAGNVIGGNRRDGIDVTGSANAVLGNQVGGALSIGNGGIGVFLGDGASTNSVGGTAAGAGNVIAFNGKAGVAVGVNALDSTTVHNAILSNRIFNNLGLGIDLGDNGVTPNTPGGPHTGPNDFQNFPVMAAKVSKGFTIVRATLNSIPNTTFTIQFYLDPTPDPSGYGQGTTLLGTATLLTTGTGKGSTSLTVAGVLTGQYVTATATAPSGDTSEFAKDLVVSAKASPAIPDVPGLGVGWLPASPAAAAPPPLAPARDRPAARPAVAEEAPHGSAGVAGETGSLVRPALARSRQPALDAFFAAWDDPQAGL